MVPGFTETECRIAELRCRESRAEAERRRRADEVGPVPTGRVSIVKPTRRHVGPLLARARRALGGMRAWAQAERGPAPDAFVVGE